VQARVNDRHVKEVNSVISVAPALESGLAARAACLSNPGALFVTPHKPHTWNAFKPDR
jgi:hypothetical protein